MSTIIIILLISILIILIIILNTTFKNSKNSTNMKSLRKELNILNQSLNSQLTNKNMETSNLLKNTTDTLDKKISNQNVEQLNILKNTITSIETKLKEQSDTTNSNVKEIIDRISYFDNIKEQISTLNNSVVNLESILNDKKARGTFGEIRLSQIFISIFGENKTSIYEEQFALSNGKRVDFLLHAPYPIGDLPIDSKFPLENYLKIIKYNNESELKLAQANFKQDIKKHIDTISQKYIIEGETSSQAIMFIPAESIFSYIHSHNEDLINYSYNKKVWIASPSTLMAILNLLLVILKDIKRNESYDIMHNEILKLKIEFERFEKRWSNLAKHLDTVSKDVSEIDTTTSKIIKKFIDIENVNIK